MSDEAKPIAFLTTPEDVRLLVRLAIEDGGRVDPARILRRPASSHARLCFMEAQDAGWLDGSGWVTDLGRQAVAATPQNEEDR